ncbi:DUF551 domain-containing protein [Enterobacter roggenkampii]
MITFTKEQLIASAHARIEFAEMMLSGELEPLKERTWSIELELARIALASLEAEPVYQVYGNNDDTWSDVDEEEMIRLRRDWEDIRTLYTAPPATANAEPVAWLWSHRKHPSEVTLVRPEDDEMGEPGLWSGWNCQALYAAPPATVSVPEWTNEQCLEFLSIAFRHAEIKGDLELDDIRLGVKIANGSRAAMLQGAENAESTTTMKAAPALDSSPKIAESPSGNSPVIPDGWVACSERMPEDEQEVITHNIFGYRHVSFFDEHSGHFFDRLDGSPVDCVEHVLVSHWMPLPAAPQQEVKP